MTRQYDDKDMGLMDGWHQCTQFNNGSASHSREIDPDGTITDERIMIMPIDPKCGDRRTDLGYYAIHRVDLPEDRYDANGEPEIAGEYDESGNKLVETPDEIVVKYASSPVEAAVLLLKAGWDFQSVGANDAMCGDHRKFTLVREANTDEVESYYAPQKEGRPHWVKYENLSWGVAVMPWDEAYAALERAYELTLGFTYYLHDVTDKLNKTTKGG